MKNLLICFSICLNTGIFAQWEFGWYTYDFEDSLFESRISFQSSVGHSNSWQIGKPQKNNLNEAFSAVNVIITDTINSYQANDNSSFEFYHIALEGSESGYHMSFSGNYFVDSDSLNDYGLIEVSLDNKQSWINLLTDTIYNQYYFWDTYPTLTGYSAEWKYFYANLSPLTVHFGISELDTLFFRITFISDSIENERDGLMFDDLHFEDYILGISELNTYYIQIYPNPSSELLNFKILGLENKPKEITIFDILGNQVDVIQNFSKQIDISEFSPGIYTLSCEIEGNFVRKSFVKE